ncbi:NAD-dependent epimerase/dehydratase family protein [Massilia sp. CMS3.1]|uniref:NAD-dependent epimerase/dehydratase family protein n=1 Tax=Massilia sp. CMS3.1 TaxID=3373083 RepID=UPI003EE4F29A
MIFIIGGRGRLGQAIARQYGADKAVCVERSLYQDWAGPGAQGAIDDFFAPLAGRDATVFVTAGLLDPKLDPDALWQVNVELPRNIIEGGIRHRVKVTTFGTVMETLLADHNPYIRSKVSLGQYVAERAAAGERVSHIRVHTLYGAGMPSPFMFLGQMLAALEQRVPFRMTLGKQLREYHHVDDDACAIRVLDEAAALGVLDLSHGAAVSLGELARTVFDARGAEDLLQAGALPEPRDENYTTVFTRHPLLAQVAFRETLPAVVAYLEECAAVRRNT